MAKEIMSFEKCEKEFIRKVDVDRERITSIIKMAEFELEIISGMSVTKKTASKLAKDYYEIIKDLLTALLLSYGLKSSNHECLISFFYNKFPKYGYEAQLMHQLKNIRNRVSYDGYFVDEEYVSRNKSEFDHVIKLMKKLINANVPKLGQGA